MAEVRVGSYSSHIPQVTMNEPNIELLPVSKVKQVQDEVVSEVTVSDRTPYFYNSAQTLP